MSRIFRMKSFASETHSQRFPASDAQGGGGSQESPWCGSPAVALDPFLYQQMRWCEECAGEQLFVPMFETDFGRVGLCMGCDREKVQLFTRTTEAAA